jgi:hypothetical protein
MARWEQIGGDVNPKEYGAILARVDGNSIEVVEIVPNDEGKGWYVVTADYDASDLEWDGSAKGSRIASSIGASKSEWEKMSLMARAEAAMGYHGGNWSQGAPQHEMQWSSALPAASNSIKWWRR